MQTVNPLAHTDAIGLNTLERADPGARTLQSEMPDVLVFDPDSKRMGAFGGFFLADDCNSRGFRLIQPSEDPNSHLRVNGPNTKIPGIHLPDTVHFALVAAGPLFTVPDNKENPTKDIFHFEAIAFCREVIDPETNEPALLKITTRGPAAVKLHHYLTIGITDPLSRMNAYYHDLAKTLFDQQQISKQRYDRIISQQTTPQMIWLPVSIERGVQIGIDEKNSVTGTMIHTDEADDTGMKFHSRWPLVQTRDLITPDTENGLLLTGPTQIFCQQNRLRYETALIARAAYKGEIRLKEPRAASSPAFSRSSTSTITNNSAQPALLNEIRQRLQALHKKETDQDVLTRIRQFGATGLTSMKPDQLAAFKAHISDYTNRVAAAAKPTPQRAPQAA